MNSFVNSAADGRIIVDRAYIETSQKRDFITRAVLLGIPFILNIILEFYFIFRMGIDFDSGKSLVFPIAFFGLFLFILGFSLKRSYVKLRAVLDRTYSLEEDVILKKNSSSDSEGGTSYYIVGAASGKHTVNSKIYRKAQTGETFWYVSLQTKKKRVNYAAYPSSSFVLSDELAMYVRKSTTVSEHSGVLYGAPSCTADSAPVPTAPYTAANDRKVTSHYGASHGKVTCASCGKKFDCHKHGDTCPKCGAVRVK